MPSDPSVRRPTRRIGAPTLVTIEEALRRALVEAPLGRVTFARDFQGFPGTVHGGAVAALFYRVTTPRPPVRLRMELQRGAPTETPLALGTGRTGSKARLWLAQDDRRLAEAELSREDVVPPDVSATVAAWRQADRPAAQVPGTATCLACGSANPLGLGLRFHVSERFLWREFTPPDAYRAADGSLHAALVTVALDELGWWLGALAQGECGVTTEVTITVFRRLPFAPLVLIGDRDAVATDADNPRGRYVRTRGLVCAADGTLLAQADVRFAGSRAYTRRLLGPFLETTDPAALFELIPGARTIASRAPSEAEPPR
jgi:hypothetical protein